MKRLTLLVPIVALVFNLVLVLATWPMGQMPNLGSDEFARSIFLAKTPVNAALVLIFLVAFISAEVRQGRWRTWRNFGLAAMFTLGLILSWAFNANRIFKTLRAPEMVSEEAVDYPDDLTVISVTKNQTSHAYPLQYLAYHHLVSDSVEGQAVDVTYCVLVDSVSAFVRQTDTTLDLVAARGENSVYRDRETGSWWQQATGEAIAGGRLGESLATVTTERLSFADWRARYPNGSIMQADPDSEALYDQFFPDLWPE